MLLSLSDHDQAFGAHREQPDGQIQASDEVEHFEEDHSLDTRVLVGRHFLRGKIVYANIFLCS